MCPCKKPGDLRLQVATKVGGKRSARASISDSRDRKPSSTILFIFPLYPRVCEENWTWKRSPGYSGDKPGLKAKLCHEKEGGWVARDKSGVQGAQDAQSAWARARFRHFIKTHTHARAHTTKFPQIFNSSDSLTQIKQKCAGVRLIVHAPRNRLLCFCALP